MYLRTRYRSTLGCFFWFGLIHVTIRRNLVNNILLQNVIRNDIFITKSRSNEDSPLGWFGRQITLCFDRFRFTLVITVSPTCNFCKVDGYKVNFFCSGMDSRLVKVIACKVNFHRAKPWTLQAGCTVLFYPPETQLCLRMLSMPTSPCRETLGWNMRVRKRTSGGSKG